MGSQDYNPCIPADPRLASAGDALRSYANREQPLTTAFYEELEATKTEVVEAGDDAAANAIWCLETIAAAQDHYLAAWSAMQGRRYFAGWCQLDEAEIALRFLGRHFSDIAHEFGVAFLETQIPRWQSLFPYQVFLSPGFVKSRIHCSICDARLTPRRMCDHKLGELYMGEQCGHVVKEIKELLEISAVRTPAQKYSVAFLKGERYNYAAVHYVVEGLTSPWARWEPRHSERRRVDPSYLGVGQNQVCPCGSGKKLKQCHLHAANYARHIEITFHDGARPGLPAEELDVLHYGIDDVGADTSN